MIPLALSKREKRFVFQGERQENIWGKKKNVSYGTPAKKKMPGTGLEPTQAEHPLEPESSASTNSATPASQVYMIT